MIRRWSWRPGEAGPTLAAALLLALFTVSCATHAPQPGTPPVAPPTAAPAAPATPATPPAPTASAVVFPGATWERADRPESVGFSSVKLEAVRERLATMATTGLVAVSQGRVFFEYGNITEVSYIASVRKSVLAMLFGNYVESGKVRLDKTLAEMGITDHGGLTPQEQEATIADLLSAKSGVYHPASNAGDNLADAPPRGSQKHGTYFLYSNWDFNALGTIFEQETGRGIYDALETDLARPIGLEDFQRALHRKSGDLERSIHPAYHMHFSTRDMARIGYLMLHEGNWNGRQVVPRAWARRIVTPVTRNTEMNPASLRNGTFGYGYLWWIVDGPTATGPFEGAYTGMGAGGQFISVLPKLDLVVAHKKKVPPSDRSVGGGEYFRLLGMIADAYSGLTARSGE